MSKKSLTICVIAIFSLIATMVLTACGQPGAEPAVPYEGHLFDVQAHAMMPGPGVAAAKAALAADPSVEEETKEYISWFYDKMADDLEGELRLADLGEKGIQVVTCQMGFPPGMSAEESLGIVTSANEWMAARAAANPQLIGIATVAPPPTLAAAGMAEEGLDACRSAIVDLGLKGILLSAQYDGVFLGDPVYEPYFALAEELAVPVIIHPAVRATGWDLVNRRAIPVTIQFMNDQRLTLLDLVKAGVLENHPNLTIIATHLGGSILHTLERIEQVSDIFPAEQWYIDLQGQRNLLPHSVSYYLKTIYYDCNNADVEDIVSAAKKVGIDHLLTGTDFPFFKQEVTREILGNLPFSDEEKEAIAYKNATKLFGMES
jgi:predicted TIM-barrel fold metal-dependent hydrolase